MSRPRASLAAGLVAGLLAGGGGVWLAGHAWPSPEAGVVPSPADSSPVVARVGAEILTTAQLEARWSALAPSRRAFYERRGGRKELLDEVVDELALAQEARSRGLQSRPDVVELVRSSGNRALATPLLAEIREGAVGEGELRAWWEAHGEELRRPLEVDLSEIVVTSRGGSGPSDDTPDALSARAKIERLRASAVAGEDFAALARSQSESPTGREGGRLGWIGEGDLPRAYEAAAMVLKPGEVSAVLDVPEGHVVLVANDRRESAIPTFEESRERILERLLADDPEAVSRRYRAVVDEARRRLGVEVHPESLPAGGGG